MAIKPQPRAPQGPAPRQPAGPKPAPRPPARPSSPRPLQPGVPRQPPRTPGVRPPPRPRVPVRTGTGGKSGGFLPQIDKRQLPSDSWSIGKWWRRSPVASALAVFFADANISPDMTADAMSPAARNNLALSDWPEVVAPPVIQKGRIVGMDLYPVEVPVIAPVPLALPDVLPIFDPWVPPPLRRPMPFREPVPAARPLGPRPRSPKKTQAEITLVISRVPSQGNQPGIRVRAVQKFKYQVYANTPRRIDRKGVYLRLQKMVTATFGTITEVQDFVEAAAWNIVDKNGRPVMGRATREALDMTEGMSSKFARGVVVNFASYYAAFDGLIEGKYSLDLGGFVFDYAVAQASDAEVAAKSKAMERWGRTLGLDTMQGVQATISMHRRIHDMPKAKGESLVRELSDEWKASFKRRVYWSRSGGLRPSP